MSQPQIGPYDSSDSCTGKMCPPCGKFHYGWVAKLLAIACLKVLSDLLCALIQAYKGVRHVEDQDCSLEFVFYL